jgi:hypothetical protein
MKVFCIHWEGSLFTAGMTYSITKEGYIISGDYTSASKWFDYPNGKFIIATDLNKALA